MQSEHYHTKPIELNGSYSLPDLMSIVRENANQYFKRESSVLENPSMVKNFVRDAIGCEESECFGILFLDNKHRLIKFKILFNGTIDETRIHIREVVKQALKYNSSAVILCHNHPSGVTNPSRSDVNITHKLNETLQIVDIRVIDHIIVGNGCTSLAELGLLYSESTQENKVIDFTEPTTPKNVDFYQVWEKTVIPEETYKDPCSPEFLTEAEAKKYIKNNKERFDGEPYINKMKRFV